jgi:hypothetical protein
LLGSFGSARTTPNPIFVRQLQQGVTTSQTLERNAQGSLTAYQRAHPGQNPIFDPFTQQLATARTQELNAQRSLTAYERSHPTPKSVPSAPGAWSPAGVYATTHIPAVVAQQAQAALAGRVTSTMGVSSSTATAFVNSMVAASKLKGVAAQDTGARNAEVSLVAAATAQKDAADHGKQSANQLMDTAKQEAATLSKLMSSADDQTTAANTTQASANSLRSAASALASAAQALNGAAANARTALLPSSLHAASKAGAGQSVARK